MRIPTLSGVITFFAFRGCRIAMASAECLSLTLRVASLHAKLAASAPTRCLVVNT